MLVCEEFSITVVIDKDFGSKINSATISIEPWKLLEAQVNKLNSITSEDKIAIKIMRQGPGLITKNPIHTILKGQDAAKNKVSKSDITHWKNLISCFCVTFIKDNRARANRYE